jgi:hypothetical protein
MPVGRREEILITRRRAHSEEWKQCALFEHFECKTDSWPLFFGTLVSTVPRLHARACRSLQNDSGSWEIV